MKRINLCWAKNPKNDCHNFGDDMNPYLVSRLTGKRIVYIKFAGSRWSVIKNLILTIVRKKYVSGDLRHFLRSLFIRKYIVAAGSVLSWYSSKRALVWGAGIMSKTDTINDSSFLCVRGELTRKRIMEFGYQAPIAIGDPAILLPLLYNPIIEKKYSIGVIPHIIHFSMVRESLLDKNIKVINLNSANIEEVIDEILACDCIFSSSLHGLIVPHAYNIPALWFAINELPLYGDNTKFYDYFSSANMRPYDPIDFNSISNLSANDLFGLIRSQSENAKPAIDMSIRRNQLLEVAPFEVQKCYLGKSFF